LKQEVYSRGRNGKGVGDKEREGRRRRRRRRRRIRRRKALIPELIPEREELKGVR